MKKALGLGLSADQLKLPPITAISSSWVRAKEWEDVLTVHADDSTARTWRALESRIGAWTFSMEQGIIQVRCAVCTAGWMLTIGGVRYCVRQLRSGWFISWRNSNVEYAVR